MRRSGSSSCMLRPKASLSQEDLQRLASGDGAPSATVLTIDRLPSYCTDRLYLLSELQVHANSIRFLCDVGNASNASDVGVAGGASVGSNVGSASPPAFPPSIILYLLWKPNTYPTPRSFADGPLSECVRRCLLANGDEAPSEELESARTSPRSSPCSPRRPSVERSFLPSFDASGFDAQNNTNLESEPRQEKPQQKEQLTKIYVVVDRISASESNDSLEELPCLPDLSSSPSYEALDGDKENENAPMKESSENQSTPEQEQEHSQRKQTKEEREQEQWVQHNNEIKTAEQLARAVSSSPFLRTRIDGILVGITSDGRAAPGLEACMDTVKRGAKERRWAARDSAVKSRIKQQQKKKKQKKGTAVSNAYLFARGDDAQHSALRELSLEQIREQSPERSPIALVAMQPDDLEPGDVHDHHDHSHHHHGHAEEKILQCRVSTEWNGKGEYKTFSDRSMRDWRRAWLGGGGDVTINSNGPAGRGKGGKTSPKVPRISKGREPPAEEEEHVADEPISTVMVVIFLAMAANYVWNAYGDDILSLLFRELPEFVRWQ